MKTHPFASLLAVAALIATPITTRAATLFTENFTNTTGGNAQAAVNTFTDWNAYVSQKAFKMGSLVQYGYNNDASPAAPGAEQSYVLSPSTTNTPGYLGGYLVNGPGDTSGSAGTPIFATVNTGLSINTADYQTLSVSWKENKTTATTGTVTTQILLQIGGQWYVSATAFNPVAGANTAVDTTTLNFNYNSAASNWNNFTLTPGSATGQYSVGNGTMSVGSTASTDLSGTITGIGFFTQFSGASSSGAVRIDQLQIDGIAAIPEPASYAALIGVAGLGFTVLRRRRKS